MSDLSALGCGRLRNRARNRTGGWAAQAEPEEKRGQHPALEECMVQDHRAGQPHRKACDPDQRIRGSRPKGVQDLEAACGEEDMEEVDRVGIPPSRASAGWRGARISRLRQNVAPMATLRVWRSASLGIWI